MSKSICTIFVESPGSTMLFGEHAVLYGKNALVGAVDKKIYVTLTPRDDSIFLIESPLGTTQHNIKSSIVPQEPFSFALTAFQLKQPFIPSGCTLTITSDFEPTVGLGSSAAVTVAVLTAFSYWIDGHVDKNQLFRDALEVIRKVQNRGSGADLVASIYGGIVAYNMTANSIRPMNCIIPITLVYSGQKTTTKNVLERTTTSYQTSPLFFNTLFDAMDILTRRAEEAIQQKDMHTIGLLADRYNGLMDALGVNTEILSTIGYALRKNPDISGAKISGSGLGDCMLGIGRTASLSNYTILDAQLSLSGTTYKRSL